MAGFVDRGVLGPLSGRETGCGSGAERTRRPVYVTRRAPCESVCPAGEAVPRWLGMLQAGDFRKAWEVLLEATPFPAILGRVCEHRCEGACNRGELDRPVRIHAAERFLGDLAIQEGWPVPEGDEATGKRALVVGAGPAGLSAAYQLARRGHAVTVVEASSRPGGLMRYGISAYELPRSVLDAEIARLEPLGVQFVFNRRVEHVPRELEDGPYDVAFLGPGAEEPYSPGIPVGEGAVVIDALLLLRQIEEGGVPELGARVAVWGGGRTAVTVARTLRRLGVHEVSLVYGDGRERMPALPTLLQDAEDEGVRVRCETQIRTVDAGRLVLADTAGGEPREETVDLLVTALGRRPSGQLLRTVPGIVAGEDGIVTTDERMMSGFPGIYLGGDLVSDARSVSAAVGHGREAAFHMDLYLRETSWAADPPPEPATFDRLNLWYVDPIDPVGRETLPPARRCESFDEVSLGVSQDQAVGEAGRCLSCGWCCGCDGCYASCPEDAIVRLGFGQRYRVDLERCTGCAICHDQCPCGAITMIPEPHRGRAG